MKKIINFLGNIEEDMTSKLFGSLIVSITEDASFEIFKAIKEFTKKHKPDRMTEFDFLSLIEVSRQEGSSFKVATFKTDDSVKLLTGDITFYIKIAKPNGMSEEGFEEYKRRLFY